MSDCFLIDLQSITFSENTAKWIHAMRPGTYEHPLKGVISFTEERIQRFALNVKNRVRGIDPDIDFDHKEKTNEAAGWVKDAEARPDGLWLLVEWTEDGFAALKKRAYRYFSPEYWDEWTDAQGQTFKDVLGGGGLTNRPFLKDLTPINLSEIIGGSNMPVLEELRKLFGLPEGTDEATILAKAKEHYEASSTQEPPADPPPAPPVPPTNPPAPDVPSADDKPAVDPAMVAMSERVLALEAEIRHRDVTEVVTKLSEGESFSIAPTMLDEVKSLALNTDKETSNKWLALIAKIKNEGIVQLSEVGGNPNPGSDAGDSATDQLMKLAEAKMENDKISFSEAFAAVSRENEHLTSAYRNETYLREGAK